jgi:hypothetical protein
MREIVARAFTESNDMSKEELQTVVAEYEKIPAHERSFEEKMGQNLAEEKLVALERFAVEEAEKEKEAKQEEKIAELEARLEALESKEK